MSIAAPERKEWLSLWLRLVSFSVVENAFSPMDFSDCDILLVPQVYHIIRSDFESRFWYMSKASI